LLRQFIMYSFIEQLKPQLVPTVGAVVVRVNNNAGMLRKHWPKAALLLPTRQRRSAWRSSYLYCKQGAASPVCIYCSTAAAAEAGYGVWLLDERERPARHCIGAHRNPTADAIKQMPRLSTSLVGKSDWQAKHFMQSAVSFTATISHTHAWIILHDNVYY